MSILLNTTLVGGIVIYGSLVVLLVQSQLAYLGLLWSPFAALISWRLARRRGLGGARPVVAGAAYSVFLLVPWVLLLVVLLGRRLPRSVVTLLFILLYSAWLIGPILFWGQYVAMNDVVRLTFIWGPGNGAPDNWLVAYVGWAVVILIWFGSVFLNRWESDDSVTYDQLMSVRFITPFALAWAVNLTVNVYWFLLSPSG